MKNPIGRTLVVGTVALAACAFAGMVSAAVSPTFGQVRYDGNGVLAKVVDVSPVYATVPTAVAEQRCWKKRAPDVTNAAGDPRHAGEAQRDLAEQGMVRRCESVERWENREALVGYNVEYRYQGRTFRTHTEQKPGRVIRIETGLRPTVF